MHRESQFSDFMGWKQFLKPTLTKLILFLAFLALTGPLVFYYMADGQSCGKYGCSPIDIDIDFLIDKMGLGIMLPFYTILWLVGEVIHNGASFTDSGVKIILAETFIVTFCYLAACFISRIFLGNKKKRKR